MKRALTVDGGNGLPQPFAGGPISSLLEAVQCLFDWCEGGLAKQAVWHIAAVSVLVLQVALVLTHRSWLDEWQALQIGLQSPDLSAMLENLRYEGHPPLWYLLLRGTSAIVAPGYILAAIQLPIALALGCLILFKLPLSRLERLLFATNFYVLIDYVAISRSLGFGVLLFMTALLFRERRWAWIAIALLPLTDFLFGVLSLVCLAVYAREKRLWLPGVALWLLSAGVAAYAVIPAPDVVPASLPSIWWKDAVIALSHFGSVLFPLQMRGGHLQWDGDLKVVIGAPFGVAFLLLGSQSCRERFSALIFAAFCAFILIFSIVVYPLSSRHISLAGVLLVSLVALRQQRSHPSPAFSLWLGVGAVLGITAAAVNLLVPFDTSAEAAAYIRAHGLTAKHWAVYPDFENQGVSALTGMEFERVELNCMQSFVRWNHASRIKTYPALEHALESISARGSYYLLTQTNLGGHPLAHPQFYHLLTHVPQGYDGKDYFLYRVRPDLPEQSAKVPQCAPKRRPLPTEH